MPRIGVAMGKFTAVALDDVRHPVADQHAAQGLITVGHSLGKRHQVRRDMVVVGAEPFAQPAEPANDLIGDQQNILLPANSLNLWPVARRRDDHTTGPLHGLCDKGRHVIRPELRNPSLQGGRRLATERLRVHIAALAIPVGLIDMGNVVEGFELLVHEAHAAEAGSSDGRTVIGVLAADHEAFAGPLAQIPVAPHNAQLGIVGFRAAAREEHVIEMRRSDPAKATGEFNGGRVGTLKKAVVIGQLLELPINRLGNAILTVAQTHTPQPGHAVEYFATLRVVDVGPLRPSDDAAPPFGQLLEVGEGVQIMAAIQGLPILTRPLRRYCTHCMPRKN